MPCKTNVLNEYKLLQLLGYILEIFLFLNTVEHLCWLLFEFDVNDGVFIEYVELSLIVSTFSSCGIC